MMFGHHVAHGSQLCIWFAAILTAGAGVGCALSPDDHTDTASGERSSALTTTNGLGLNGLGLNGLGLNGLGLNGLGLNGLGLNGLGLNGLGLNGLDVSLMNLNGVELDTQEEADFEEVIPYLVECALSETQSVTIYDSVGQAHAYSGLLGLAEEWADGPLSAAGERFVSACLGARSNPEGLTVQLSLRHASLATTAVERDLYRVHEGAFWGTVWGPNPVVYACQVEGGGLSGRVCSESSVCGFTFVGDCAEVCDLYDPVDGYSQCGDDDTVEVINTFLGLGSRTTFGDTTACALEEDRTLWCRGDNDYGQLGDGTTVDRTASEPVIGLEPGAVEAASHYHACARRSDGGLWCWGRNGRGQVGDGSALDSAIPVHVADDAATFMVGNRHTCMVKTDGSAWCWGHNEHGEVGDGSTAGRRKVPTPVAGLSQAVAKLSAGTSARHTCAIKSHGKVFCWGMNDFGQLGDGTVVDRGEPVRLDLDADGNNFGKVTNMCASRRQSCARKAGGALFCWGDGTTLPSFVDDEVAPEGLACSENHVCYVKNDSTVWCFGKNQYGQLGREASGAEAATPGRVEGLRGVSLVNVGRTMSCATRVNGHTLCWGTEPNADTEEPPLFPIPLTITPTRVDHL
ncbi:RCC1 domain-containing protein [Haliangium sp.]|uniref:RCC1 domain-containing protein n=1 Tax=Haliangium sp. TaxID=2663208 RepID=UPI003D142C84